MILIADCGSTKIDWCVVRNGKVEKQVFTCGMNAVMLTEEEMRARIAAELMPELAERAADIEAVYFYGAGCISPDVCANVERAIRANIPAARTVEVHTDLLAAARALCGRRPGIACIMGTGSNSCFYDGEKICCNISPLGYILGDEGSGAVLGKLLVGAVLKQQLPVELCEKFLAQYDLTLLDIIRRVYKEPQGNRFLASLTPFLIENIGHPEVRALVLGSFRDFFRRNVAHYKGMCPPVANFIGSIAYYYSDPLREAAAAEGFDIGTILKSPMEGLVKFHS